MHLSAGPIVHLPRPRRKETVRGLMVVQYELDHKFTGYLETYGLRRTDALDAPGKRLK